MNGSPTRGPAKQGHGAKGLAVLPEALQTLDRAVSRELDTSRPPVA